jgi:hypothetical protein
MKREICQFLISCFILVDPILMIIYSFLGYNINTLILYHLIAFLTALSSEYILRGNYE